jgi:thiamine biosynthesis lipoprotein
MRWSRRDFLTAATLAPLGVAIPAQSSESLSRIGGYAFGTAWRITFAADIEAARVRQMAERVINQVDFTMSPYRADTALSRFNAQRSIDWQPMPRALCAVLNASVTIAQLSSGAFDPAVGPLVGRFGFGPIQQAPAGSYQDIGVRSDAIRKGDPGLCLDLCGIAKGHALDRMAVGMRRLEAANFFIELGGEVFACGRHPHGRSWHAAIEQPISGPTAIQRIIRLDNMALATSADSANFYERAGRRYSHIIDPATGQPVDNGLASVSVIAADAMSADGWATALMVMGPKLGLALAQRAQISALFVERKKAALYETMTGLFASLLVA